MIDIFEILSSRRCLKSGDFAAAQGMGNVGTVNNLKILKLNQHLFLSGKRNKKEIKSLVIKLRLPIINFLRHHLYKKIENKR